MISRVHTCTTIGLQGHIITIEGDSTKALPGIDIVGLPDASIKEAKERVRATFRNIDLPLPARRIVLNLSPSDIKKYGTRFDLPMAMTILTMLHPQADPENTRHTLLGSSLFFGELGLDGHIKPIHGLLPAVIAGRDAGYTTVFCPRANAPEVSVVPHITVYAIDHFRECEAWWSQGQPLPQYNLSSHHSSQPHIQNNNIVGFDHIKGHTFAKRAITVAACGMHNVLMVGAPGSGKTMLAKALQSLLPPLTFEEKIDVSQIYSVAGKLDSTTGLVQERPFRAVHHTASPVAIIGGGSQLFPGEISLAHKGILFFDELPEFPRAVLEVLRQPLEDKVITISRAAGSTQYPAHFMFVGAMNPCPCGYYQDPHKSCICSLETIRRYQAKISGPLLDRFDMIIEVPRESIDTILEQQPSSEGMSQISGLRDMIATGIHNQHQRFHATSITHNAQMNAKHIQDYITLDHNTELFLKQALAALHLSPRVMHRLLKVARTIADMNDETQLSKHHIAEALQYRSRTMFI